MRTLVPRGVKTVRVVILAEEYAVADGFSKCHWEVPRTRESGIGGRERISRPKGCAKEIALVIPIPKVAAHPHGEDRSDIFQREIIGGPDTHRIVVASAAARKTPEVRIRGSRWKVTIPCFLVRLALPEKSGVTSPRGARNRIFAFIGEVITNDSASCHVQRAVTKRVVLLKVLPHQIDFGTRRAFIRVAGHV